MFEEESIYNLIIPEKIVPQKGKMYRSQFPGVIDPTCSTFNNRTTEIPGVNNIAGDLSRSIQAHDYRGNHSQFGKPKLNRYKSQLEPLKKQSHLMGNNNIEAWNQKGERQRSLSPQNFSQKKIKLKPIVPNTSMVPKSPQKEPKNFIKANSISALLCEPKLKKTDVNYLQKKDFGQIPTYLTRRKEEIMNEYELAQSVLMEKEKLEEEKKYLLNQEEVDQLRKGLMEKWNLVNQKYQLMTHMQRIDTVGQLRKKQTLEKELTQIEKDIQKLSRSYVFVETGK